jgi:hypothetical protein
MNTLRLNIINLHAPYRVWQKSGKPDHYYFVSDSGVEFNIDFKLDYAFVPSGAFEFSITNERHGQSPLDTTPTSIATSITFRRLKARWMGK